jgi:hypothetical protein
MPGSGLTCSVLLIEKADVFGKVVPHYKLTVKHTELHWEIIIKYMKIVSFSKKLCQSWNNDLNEIEKSRYIQKYDSIPKSVKSNTVESVQEYMNSVLEHPWSSSSAVLLEFLGAATTSRHNTKRTVLHVSQLKEYVQPGDIILFKCSDRWNAVTRLTLRSNFDHCAVVVQNIDGCIKLLESTGEGVHTYPLVGRLRGYYLADYVNSICVRRIIKRKEQVILREEEEEEAEGYFFTEEDEGECGDSGRSEDDLLEGAKFVKAVEGKPYQLRHVVTHGLSRYKSSSGGSDSEKSSSSSSSSSTDKRKKRLSTATSGTQKGYFCSEVCAAYLKSLRILPNNEAHCAAYWPSSFDVGGDIEKDILEMGYKMDDIVELNLRILEMAKAKDNVDQVTNGIKSENNVLL